MERILFMKKTIVVLILLISALFTVRGVKIMAAINPPESTSTSTETAWYETRYSTPQAEDDWTLDPEIPDNYVPVPGEDEMYMVIDDTGNIINYRQRTQSIDGTWEWEDIADPDLAIEIEPVEGVDDVYKMTDEEDVVTYQKYVRNPDNSYAFVETDENGVPTDDGSSADEISDYYYRYADNIYALYNENGVLIGYRERVSNGDGTYFWSVVDAPASANIASLESILQDDQEQENADAAESSNKVTNQNGSYTVTKKSTESVTENGYTVVYQTTVYYTYDKDGTLTSTKKDGPTEISRTQIGTGTVTPNTNLIASTLDGELARVSESVTFNTDKANEMLTLLNEARTDQGLSALSMSTDSEAYKLACIKAADMAIYGYSATESPMYGTLDDMITRYGCTSSNPSENIWKAMSKSASEIHSRFQSNESSRTVRMSDYTQVGIAIVDVDGNTYVAEVFLK